ncbi:MAG TPA: hypothetical protein VL371_23770, partial [Gemmataceae bacterium]|nr:hypothetical protein [Gemmataceae bacterium]
MSASIRWSRVFYLAALLAVFGGPGFGAAIAPEEDEPFLPGLTANYRDPSGTTVSRPDYQLSFHWGDAPPDPRLGAGDFAGIWQGNVQTLTKGDYRFFVFGTGEIELKVAGQVVITRNALKNEWRESTATPLPADLVPFELSFRRTTADARLMVCWSGPDFGLEPIPPHALYHPRERTIKDDFARGAALARTLRCGRCHG